MTLATSEPLVLDGVRAWVDAGMNDLQWQFDPHPPFDAQAFLLADLSRAGGAIVPGSPTVIGSQRYILDSFTTFVLPGEERPPGCEDAPPDATIFIENFGFALVTVYELNATLDL